MVEPSLGADRMTLALLVEAYDEEVVDAEKNDVRTVMRFHPAIAPFKCAVLPLSKKLSEKAREIQAELSKDWMVDFDDTGSIGKRYRREDEIGTPYCITVDFDTVGDADKAGRQLRYRPGPGHHGAGAAAYRPAEELSGGETGILMPVSILLQNAAARRPSIFAGGKISPEGGFIPPEE